MARAAGTTVPPCRPGRWVWASVASLLLLGACQRDGVRHYIVEKERDAVPAATAGAAAPQPAVAEGGVRWTLPAGWQERQGGGDMRHATLTPPGAKAEVTVVRLSGPAGGELANVNRWRNQLGLPPLGEPDLAPARKILGSAAGELAVYDFTSAGAEKLRTVAGLTSIQGETWFFKLTGDADAVATVRPAFLDLLGSLRLDAR